MRVSFCDVWRGSERVECVGGSGGGSGDSGDEKRRGERKMREDREEMETAREERGYKTDGWLEKRQNVKRKVE